jgi:hypothetical protein
MALKVLARRTFLPNAHRDCQLQQEMQVRSS